MPKSFLLFFIASLLSPVGGASSKMSCEFQVKIQQVSKDSISINVIGAPGTSVVFAPHTKSYCLWQINDGKIPIKKISSGKDLAKKGVKLTATWNSYSGMGEKGPITATYWELKK